MDLTVESCLLQAVKLYGMVLLDDVIDLMVIYGMQDFAEEEVLAKADELDYMGKLALLEGENGELALASLDIDVEDVEWLDQMGPQAAMTELALYEPEDFLAFDLVEFCLDLPAFRRLAYQLDDVQEALAIAHLLVMAPDDPVIGISALYEDMGKPGPEVRQTLVDLATELPSWYFRGAARKDVIGNGLEELDFLIDQFCEQKGSRPLFAGMLKEEERAWMAAYVQAEMEDLLFGEEEEDWEEEEVVYDA